MTDITIRQSEIADRIGDVLDVLTDPQAPLPDKVAAYAVGDALHKRIGRALGKHQKGPTAQTEILTAMQEQGLDELGPLYIGWTAFDVEYPCNQEGNWTDSGVQEAMQAIRDDPATHDYIRAIPAHLEIDVAALGADVHAGSEVARHLWNALRDRRWRTEGGKRASLKVREPKKAKAAA